MFRTTLLLLACGACLLPAAPAALPPVGEARVAALRELRFGMFVCWSFSTFSGREWTGGVTDVGFFRATAVDTDQWARTAKEAGMGYVLFLTKHHDGFCLWDTRTTGRKVTRAPLGRDVLADVRRSCDRFGLKLALYYSEGDWTWPGAVDGKSRHEGVGRHPEMKRAQLRELLTEYGPIEYIWFDHAVGDGGLGHADTLAFCKALQPDCFVGFNNGPQEGADIRLGERGRPGSLDDPRAARPVVTDPPAKSYRLAEFTYPILPRHQGGAQWFYSLPQHDRLCQPAEKIYADYLGAVRYGNLFALNVGPDYCGRLRAIDVATLRRVGEMIRAGAPVPAPYSAASYSRPARASGTWGPGHNTAAANAVDGDRTSRWAAPAAARSGWLEVDLGAPVRVGRVVVDEGDWNRVRRFEIAAEQEGGWRTVAAGTTLGPAREISFPPATARVWRLHILDAVDVPTILEFEVYAGP